MQVAISLTHEPFISAVKKISGKFWGLLSFSEIESKEVSYLIWVCRRLLLANQSVSTAYKRSLRICSKQEITPWTEIWNSERVPPSPPAGGGGVGGEYNGLINTDTLQLVVAKRRSRLRGYREVHFLDFPLSARAAQSTGLKAQQCFLTDMSFFSRLPSAYCFLARVPLCGTHRMPL